MCERCREDAERTPGWESQVAGLELPKRPCLDEVDDDTEEIGIEDLPIKPPAFDRVIDVSVIEDPERREIRAPLEESLLDGGSGGLSKDSLADAIDFPDVTEDATIYGDATHDVKFPPPNLTASVTLTVELNPDLVIREDFSEPTTTRGRMLLSYLRMLDEYHAVDGPSDEFWDEGPIDPLACRE